MTAFLKKKNIILIAFLVVASISFIKTTHEILSSSHRLDELKQEVEDLESKKVTLQKEIEHINSQEYVEEVARNNLNMIKPGEKVYVVAGDSMQDYVTTEDSKPDVLGESKEKTFKDSNLYHWYKLFF